MTETAHGSSPFAALPARVDFAELDREVIGWWKANDVFARSLAKTADGPPWVFYEGPPTANGSPGTHHVEARVFKDVLPRYRTMKGYSVPRRAGWDCHGLPVELAVEKELGLNGKPDIEKVGIAEFNDRCRQSVLRHVGEFEALTERMGYWTDLDHAYTTMSPEYVDSAWWALKRIFDAGRLFQDHRVAPYCPRCGTTLSDHEVSQGYENVEDPSVYVRFPVLGQVAGIDGADLVVWTTTPWTLVSNTAVAVNPEVEYVVARTGEGTFVVASALRESVLGEAAEVLAAVPGRELVGLRYRRPFDAVDIPDAHLVLAADFVTTEDGTGLVHLSPAHGVDDLAACRAAGLPVVTAVGPDGRFAADLPLVGGMFFKDADEPVQADLRARGLLLRAQRFEHAYPHCWRCHTPLMYYAQLSWYIRTTEVRDELRRENERTNWYPEHIKHGRYGDWLDNNVDWALSRSRYWGTPLPLWRCGQGHVTAVGSRAELGELVGEDLSGLDPHRPFVDEVTFSCPDCGGRAERVPEVIDAWFDSGCMPFAQLGYPHVPGSAERFARAYPAQYICEAIDQTRGWFYTLMAVGTLVFDRSSYENVVCLGHILAEDGRKMSKHLGNILEPIPLMDRHGADALRWFMACSGSPWAARRVGHEALDDIARKVLMTYWNTASFFTLYASHAQWPQPAAPAAERGALDRWVLGEVHELARVVDERLQDYDTAGAGRRLAEFVDDLSNWYVRRSRSRFWAGQADAFATLFECLDVLTRLLAPFVPFIAEKVWQRVVRPGLPDAPESVHLADWPTPDAALVDPSLAEQMRAVRALTEAGRAARKASKIRVRQPLRRALFGVPAGLVVDPSLLEDLAAELNVKSVLPLAGAGEVVEVTVKPNYRELGKRFGKRTGQVAAAVSAADPAEVVAALRAERPVEVVVDGERLRLEPAEVLVTEVPKQGWVVKSQRDTTIALDVELTPELEAEGTARDVVRAVQQARRDAELELTDRIAVTLTASAGVVAAVEAHRDFVAAETLATSLELVPDASAADDGPRVQVSKV
ncbi:isoleucyl-tRNA synthetase [Saccharothrix coeruleofusca]|uniref:isoleucine--tRNA ligase n=1 Tax=Saccharothrix coeruleofusca TaxID=33919 RepID=UPI001AE906B3|nr:isoleucine--tRNA ligase [Saccharothrix coeruleofusca]MBP2335663.1 isoleucyl-tRNA synthetase [Saccharothrix coeruleofusca]